MLSGKPKKHFGQFVTFFCLSLSFQCHNLDSKNTDSICHTFYNLESIKNQEDHQSWRKPDWIPLSGALSLGFYTEPVFFKIECPKDKLTGELFIENQASYIDSITLWEWSHIGFKKTTDGANSLNRNNLFPRHPNPIFRLDQNLLQKTGEVYLEVRTVSNFFITPKVINLDELNLNITNTRDFFLIYVIVLSISLLLNVNLFIHTRNPGFVYYSIYLFFSLVYQTSFLGFGKIYLWPNSPEWNSKSLVFTGSLALLSVVLFSYKYLKINIHLPKFKFLYLISSVFVLFNAILYLIHKTIISEMIIHVLGIIISFSLLLIGIYLWRKKFTMAKYYVFAWTFLLISVLCLNLYAFNILPDHFIFRHSIQIGNLLECLLFQIALIDRIREPKDLPKNLINKEILRTSSDLRLGNINAEQKYAELMDLIVLNKIYRDEDLNLERVANLLKIRPDQLSALLNNKTGIHFNQWINQFRIQESCELIQKFPNEPVLKIAFDVGFNSKSAFNNAFKKSKGISPSEFKTQV